MAASSEMADQFLCTDGDYDLIISDLRSGKDREEGTADG
jgi:hypothetical protein